MTQGSHTSQSGEGNTDSSDANVTHLEHSLWLRLENGADARHDDDDWNAAWLELLSTRIGECRAAALVSFSGASDAADVLAKLPADQPAARTLLVEARRAAEARTGAVSNINGAPGLYAFAYPVAQESNATYVVAIASQSSSVERNRNILREMQWASAWFRGRIKERALADAESAFNRLRVAAETLAGAIDRQSFSEAAMTTATELASRFSCDRVSVAFMRGQRARIAAISHAARFAERMEIVQLVQAAMEEAIDQKAALIWPAEQSADYALRAHEALARKLGSANVLTVPMIAGDRMVGALTLERQADPFSQEALDVLQTVASIVGPVLEEKRLNDRWLITKAGESLINQAKFTLGPTHFTRKVVILAILALAVFLYSATGMYRVTADARIEGAVQRAIVAPFDGFLRAAKVRAGDLVKKGSLLAELDDRDLTMERLRWVTERQQKVFAYEKALSDRQRSDANVAKVQIEQADARIDLIDAQMERTRLSAPFAGLVISGDHSQQIGGAVSRGEVLFEIAPLEGYRVVLHVDEGQIAEIKSGDRGELIVASLPTTPFEIIVDQITPVAKVADGHNVFKVDARVEGDVSRLRPGMEGIAKVDVEERRLISNWTRSLINWLQLFYWKWSG